jgi:hemoglobin-like flavoprotein
MSPDQATIRTFRASLERAVRAPDFYDRFYGRFMGASEEIRALFRDKDMARIRKKLGTTLEMLSENADGQPGLAMYLELLGRIHRGMSVSPRHFSRWREALIATAAECDPDFDPASRAAWEAVIADILAKMGEEAGGATSGIGP